MEHSFLQISSVFLPPMVLCLNISADLRNKWHLVIDRLTVLFLKFLEYFHKMQVFVWWLLELHIIKIVSSYIIWVTVKEASKHPLPKSYPWWRLVSISCAVAHPNVGRCFPHIRPHSNCRIQLGLSAAGDLPWHLLLQWYSICLDIFSLSLFSRY